MSRPRFFVWHPFVLSLYPVLLIYTRNNDSVYFGEILATLIVVSLVTLGLWAVLRRFYGDGARAGLLTSAVLFVAFSFERNVHALQVRRVVASPVLVEWLVLVAGLVALLLWWVVLRSWPALIRTLSTMANAASLALVALLIPGLAGPIRVPTTPRKPAEIISFSPPDADRFGGSPTRRDPDIYWIVLDAFGRSDVLKSMFDYDNEAFLGRMERRGFYLARQSTSNYCQTALSISATLSGQYHDDLAGSTSKSRLLVRDLMRDNPFCHLLRSRHYKLVGFASGFGLTDGFRADERLAPAFDLGEFSALVLDMTPTWTLLGQGAGQASHGRHRERILNIFDHLADVAADPAPTFCLAHVLSPHPPFVFDAEGNDLSPENTSYRLTDGKLWSALDGHGGPDDYASHYRNQAAYLSMRVEQTVDQILARSPSPPVIIIQGDHGPGSHFDPDDDRPNDVVERMSILNLCLIPGEGSQKLYPTMSPVNTFRIIADSFFDTNLGLLSDRNYYSSYQSPYVMTDVTSEVAGKSAGKTTVERR